MSETREALRVVEVADVDVEGGGGQLRLGIRDQHHIQAIAVTKRKKTKNGQRTVRV